MIPIGRVAAARTFLFVPGDRPDRYSKAAGSGADLVVLDLEDAVAPAMKEQARSNAEAFLRTTPAFVRVNGMDTPWFEDDLEMLREVGAGVMLPKAEHPDQIAELTAQNQLSEVIALVETSRGFVNVSSVASVPGVARLAFGSFDLAAELGVRPDDREAMLTARGSLVLASAAAGLPGPIDGVTGAIDDSGSIADDVRYAKRLGFTGKLCIHPRQIAAAAGALQPSTDELDWAARILRAADGADSAGVLVVDGRMVDKPVIDRARRLLVADPGEGGLA